MAPLTREHPACMSNSTVWFLSLMHAGVERALSPPQDPPPPGLSDERRQAWGLGPIVMAQKAQEVRACPLLPRTPGTDRADSLARTGCKQLESKQVCCTLACWQLEMVQAYAITLPYC